MVWAGISIVCHTVLQVFLGVVLTGVRYRDETLDQYAHPCTVSIGNDFIQIYDDARTHQALLVVDYLVNHV